MSLRLFASVIGALRAHGGVIECAGRRYSLRLIRNGAIVTDESGGETFCAGSTGITTFFRRLEATRAS